MTTKLDWLIILWENCISDTSKFVKCTQSLLLLAGPATSVRTCEGVPVKVVLRIDQLTATALTGSEVTATALTGSEVTATALTGSEVTATALTGSEVTATEVIRTEMTVTVIEEVIVIAVVIHTRATATREAVPQRLHLCSSSLSRHLLFVAVMIGTGIVLEMSGRGTYQFNSTLTFVAHIVFRYEEPPRFAPPPSFDDRGRGGYADRCQRFLSFSNLMINFHAHLLQGPLLKKTSDLPTAIKASIKAAERENISMQLRFSDDPFHDRAPWRDRQEHPCSSGWL
jgi:hypothetical protein